MQYLKDLNDKQLEAVRETEGYVRVIAGAGSGKTKLLVSRYAYLVKEYYIDPYNILCVTFTNKAAREMKNRIEKIIGNQFDTNLICTYHGFCARLIRDENNKFFLSKNYQIIDNYQQKEMLDDIYQKYELKFDYASFESMIKKITLYKAKHEDYVSKMINPDNIQILNDLDNMDNKIIEDYLQKEKLIHGLDFNDLIHFAVYILKKDKEIREKWQNRLNYILVDEFQDSSKNEMELINILSNNYKNLMIVGDPDQNIYEWRGSDVKLLVDFDKDHEPTKTIIMDRNYRSTPEILKCANSLIDKNKLRLKKDLYTLNDSKGDVIHYHVKDDEKQNEIILKEIKSLMNKYNYTYSDFAILYRSSFLSRMIEKGFVDNNIPYTIYGDVKYYYRMEIMDAIAYLKLLCFSDDTSFKRIINVPRRKMGKKKIEYLLKIQETENKTLYDILKEHLDDEIFIKTDANDFVNLIENLKDRLDESKLSEIVSTLITNSGYDTYLRSLGDEERLDNINEFKRTIEEFENTYGEKYSLKEYLREISIQMSEDDDENKEQVKLMTIHAAKGLEFKVVFVVGLSEGIFPSSRTLEERKELGLEEERRLCYVAITRAMEKLILIDTEGQSARSMNNLPSRFLFEIEEKNYKRIGKIPESIIKQYNDYVYKHSFNNLNNNSLAIGNSLNHHIFGKGKIISVDNKRNSYLVKFDNLKLPRNISKNYTKHKEEKELEPLLIENKNELINLDNNIEYDNNIEIIDNNYNDNEIINDNIEIFNNYDNNENINMDNDNYQHIDIDDIIDEQSFENNNINITINHNYNIKDPYNLWDDPNVPKEGWECQYVYDLGSASFKCQMCNKNMIRYVHVMNHKNYHTLEVGCVCAGNMQGDSEKALMMENDLKNKIKRKENFLKKTWHRSLKGNEYLKYKNHILIIYLNNKDNKISYSIDKKFSGNRYINKEDAIDAIFEDVSTIIKDEEK